MDFPDTFGILLEIHWEGIRMRDMPFCADTKSVSNNVREIPQWRDSRDACEQIGSMQEF